MPTKKKDYVLIGDGVYRTPRGYRFVVNVKGVGTKAKSIEDPNHDKYAKRELQTMKEVFRSEESKQARTVPIKDKGTFAADVREKYYGAMRVKFKDQRRQHMEYWIEQFGDRRSVSIEPWEIGKRVNVMLERGPKVKCVKWDAEHPKPAGCKTGRLIVVDEPLSAAAVAKRMRALQNFYTIVYPRLLPNPVSLTPEPKTKKGKPRDVSYAEVEQILAALPDLGRADKRRLRPDVSLTKLRLRVIAYTSLAHAELKQVGADDLHLNERIPWVLVKGREKGEGTDDVALPLLKEGAQAFKALRDAKGLGPFSNSSMWKSFKTACRKVNVKATPYSFRHAFAAEVLGMTGNLTAVQVLLRHRQQRTSKHYAEGAIDPARLAFVRQLETMGFGQGVGRREGVVDAAGLEPATPCV